MRNKQVIMVVGPTAVGKTSFAIELATHIGIEILSADSRQFYREMTIGTAVPSTDELNCIPHHFIQHLSIHEDYNVHRFEQDALALLEKLFINYNRVVVVGGSGLYLNALAYGIDELPDPSEETRQYLNQVFADEGLPGLRNLLLKLDAEFYKTIDLHNPNRIKRAIEVCLTTGLPYSQLRLGKKKERDFQIKWIGLTRNRNSLYENINSRVDKMLANGLIEEARQLWPLEHLNALNTVGYRELFSWFHGKETYEWAVEKIKTNSRRYAKRQMTWFTKNNDIRWIETDKTPLTKDLFNEIIEL